MAYEKIVSVPSTATSGQVPRADGAGGFDWRAVDAYTKAQTLTEATKIAYGLDASAVPDDVFSKLSGLYNHCWKKTKSTYTCGYSEKNAEDTMWMTYPIDVYDGTYDETGKTLSLTKIGRITCKADYPENIVGKFIAPKSNSVWPYYVCMVTGKNSVTDVDANFLCIRFDTIVVSETSREEYYVTAQDKNAYTDGGFLDGYEYEYLGVPFENATQTQVKIATGSYTGTGTYGSSNQNSLTFDFAPKTLLICEQTATAVKVVWTGQPGQGTATNFKLQNKTLSWFAGNAANQGNSSAVVYYYIAIG